MSFHAPLFAGWLVLAVAPLILYLIFRRKKRDVPWGAIYILRRLLETQRKFSEWKRYAITTIRTLAFIALPLAFMQPLLPWRTPKEQVFPSSPMSTHRIILLDLSRSMGASFANRTRHNSSLGLCRRILESASYPGRVDILPLDDEAFEPSITLDVLPLAQAVINRAISRLQLRDVPTDIEGSLRRAVQLYRSSPFTTRELYVLSDFSGRDFQVPATGLDGPLHTLQNLGVTLHCLSYEKPEADNFAVVEMTPGFDLLLDQQPTLFYVTLGYYGAKSSADTYLTIRKAGAEGDVYYDQPVTLAPGEKTMEIPLTLSAGELTLEARLKDDDLDSDNTLSRSFRVSRALRVVVSQDINLSRGFDNPRQWLRLGLKEEGTSRMKASAATLSGHSGEGFDFPTQQLTNKSSGGAGFELVNANPAQLGDAILQNADAVIMLDVDVVTENAAIALENYAMRGGTVLLAPGPNAKPSAFNRSFAQVTPSALAQPARSRIDPELYQHCVVDRLEDRVLKELEDTRHGNIGTARFYNWYTLEPSSMHKEAITLLSLSEGAELLVERRIGRGRVLLWTAGLGSDWHAMVVHSAFPVFLSRLLNIAAASLQFPLNLAPGTPIIRRVEAQKCKIFTPDNKSEALESIAVGPYRYIRYDQTQRPGTYLFLPDAQDDGVQVRYHVAENRRESDYRPLQGDARSSIEAVLGAPLLNKEQDLIDTVSRSYGDRPLAAYCAVALLGMLMLEAWLCRRLFA